MPIVPVMSVPVVSVPAVMREGRGIRIEISGVIVREGRRLAQVMSAGVIRRGGVCRAAVPAEELPPLPCVRSVMAKQCAGMMSAQS